MRAWGPGLAALTLAVLMEGCGCTFDVAGVPRDGGEADGRERADAPQRDGPDTDGQAIYYLLGVTVTGTGSGSVVSAPPGIACGEMCSASFAGGTTVTLTASPGASSYFVGWSGACSGASTCTFVLDAPATVMATFMPIGAHVWSRVIGGSFDDYGLTVAFDPGGAVIVGGQCSAAADFGGGPTIDRGYLDAFVAKYANDGTLLWAHRYGGLSDDAANDVALDAAGDVYVVGRFQASVDFGNGIPVGAFGAFDAYVAKYVGADGSLAWVRHFGAPAQNTIAFGIGTAPTGDVVATGVFMGTVDVGGNVLVSAGSYDIFVARFAPADGVVTWAARFGGSGADFGRAIAVAPGGDFVLAASFEGSVDFGGGLRFSAGLGDAMVARYAADGAHLFSVGHGSTGDDAAVRVAVDSSALMLTGYYTGTADFGGGALPVAGGKEIFQARYGVDGSYVWAQGRGGSSDDVGVGVALGPGGTAVFAGQFSGTADLGGGAITSAGYTDVYIAKLSPTGLPIWIRTFGNALDDGAQDVAVDSGGAVAVTGFVRGTVDLGGGPVPPLGGRDIFIARYAP